MILVLLHAANGSIRLTVLTFVPLPIALGGGANAVWMAPSDSTSATGILAPTPMAALPPDSPSSRPWCPEAFRGMRSSTQWRRRP